MKDSNTYIASIAGFDPSGGAGIIADVKTFEAHQLYGLSVCTAITVQNDISFEYCQWIEESIVMAQLDVLLERFTIPVVKIGIIPSWSFLLRIIKKLKKYNENIKIVLDPVLRSTTGFDFHKETSSASIEEVLASCFFVTPNFNEIKMLFPTKTLEQAIAIITAHTNLFLKGGHREYRVGWDEIYFEKAKHITLAPKVSKVYEKHGSGCVLSSALAANLCKGLPVEVSCANAKTYIETFLNSNPSLLGNHKYANDK